MAESGTAAVAAWVEALPHDTWFLGRAVPGKKGIVQPALSRMCRERRFDLVRATRGLYWRGYPEDHVLHGSGPFLFEIGALLYGGSGAGLGAWSALNRLGWTDQCDPKTTVSVVDGRLTPFQPTIRFYTSKNRRRERLNWTEVTVLEALTLIAYTEEPWLDCLEKLRSGRSASRLQWGLPIRPEALLWAGETEEGGTADLRYLLNDVVRALPEAA